MNVTLENLGLDPDDVREWFEEEATPSYSLVRVTDRTAAAWADVLSLPVRRCYLSDQLITERAAARGVGGSEIVAAGVPDPGSTMAGDFGEILVYLFQAAAVLPDQAVGPKKWALRQDRNSPAPFSDVVQFVLPQWPNASEDDQVLCTEVKLKSTKGKSEPITSAIIGCSKDRTSRFAATLAWLRDRAMLEDIDGVTVEQLDRFLAAEGYPEAQKRFSAVAVVAADLLDGELTTAPSDQPDGFTVVVLSFQDLHAAYNSVYAQVVASGDVVTDGVAP